MSTLLGCFFSELSVGRPIFFLKIPYFQEAITSFSGTMSQKILVFVKKDRKSVCSTFDGNVLKPDKSPISFIIYPQ